MKENTDQGKPYANAGLSEVDKFCINPRKYIKESLGLKRKSKKKKKNPDKEEREIDPYRIIPDFAEDCFESRDDGLGL